MEEHIMLEHKNKNMESDNPYEMFTTKEGKKIDNSFEERNLCKYYLFRKK